MRRWLMIATGSQTLGAVALLIWIPKLLGGEAPRAKEVKAQFAAQVERIKSLEVAYKLDTRSNLSPEKLRALPEYMNQLFLPRDEWRVAFKGDKRYTRQIQPERVDYLAALDEQGLAMPQDPPADAPALIKENQKELKRQYERAVANTKALEARGVRMPKRDASVRALSERDVTRGFNGRTLWMRQPATAKSDQYMIWGSTSKPNWFQVTAYLMAVGLHVADPSGEEQLRKVQSMFRLAEWIKDPSYELEPTTEVVDGSTCVILKGSLSGVRQTGSWPGELTDRIWLDRDHGLVVRKREIARSGKLSNRWTNSHLKEVEPGLWLPLTTRHEQFPSRPVDELKAKPVLIEEIKVQSIAVNRVPDERFDMVPRQGDVIEDLRGRF
jgi:hypothetical protein